MNKFNDADYVEAFANGQLDLLWQNASTSWKNLRHEQKDLSALSDRYAVALAKYIVESPENSTTHSFEATFNRPSLHLLCNHEAVWVLDLVEVRFDVASSGGTRLSDRRDTLHALKAYFSIPYEVSTINDSIALLSHDFSRAQMYNLSPSAEDIFASKLNSHLKDYFNLLQRAGHHKLFCLPNFSAKAKLHRAVDFSPAFRESSLARAYFSADTVGEVSVKQINSFLFSVWRSAKLSSITRASRSPFAGDGTILAEYEYSAQHDGPRFCILFAAPTVSVLCQHAVSIAFNIEEVLWCPDPHVSLTPRKFSGWTLSFSYRVEYSEGRSEVLSCSIQPTCRYMEYSSMFPGYDADSDSVAVKVHIENLFITDYLAHVEHEVIHTLYDSDSVHAHQKYEDEEHAFESHETSRPRGLAHGSQEQRYYSSSSSNLRKTHNKHRSWERIDFRGDFDFIITISQEGINTYFQNIWSDCHREPTRWNAVLIQWDHLEVFHAKFKPITVHLLSNERAILVIHMASGYIRAGENGVDKDENDLVFSNHELAFEVPLSLCSHTAIPGVNLPWTSRFEESFAHKEHQGTNVSFWHVCVNLADAELVPELSKFTQLFAAGAKSISFARVKALVTLIREHYFQQMMEAGYHVIQTIPVSQGAHPEPSTLTNIGFHTVSDTVVNRKILTSRSYNEKPRHPVIVISGSTLKKPLPQLCDNSLLQDMAQFRYSTICLSREVFLEPHLMKSFSNINSQITLVPSFSGRTGSNCGLELLSLAEVAPSTCYSSPPRFERNSKNEPCYMWQHCDEAVREIDQSSNAVQRFHKYKASCSTENQLTLSTQKSTSGICVYMKGRIDLSVEYTAEHAKPLLVQSCLTWKHTLPLKTRRAGLRVLKESTQQSFCYGENYATGDSKDHELECDPTSLLKQTLTGLPASGLVELASVFRNFQSPSTFSYPQAGERRFNMVYPAFNQHGDLLFELSPCIEHTSPPSSLYTVRPPSPPSATRL